MAERLLLTGATGFVGRAMLAPLAAHGFEVHAVARHAGTGAAIWHAADLLDEGAMRALLRDVRPAVLVHAAWYVTPGRFWTAPENADWVEASTALAEAFAECGGRRLLGLGTCAEYDWEEEGTLSWPETRRIAPATPYGRAKAELSVRWATMGQRRSLSVAWARLFHLFGPGEHPDRLVPAVMQALREGREAATGSGRAVRDFVSTGYLGRAIAALTASRVEGAVNTASGRPVATRVVIETIGRLIGRPDLIRLGALREREGEPPFIAADTTRLVHEVGFTERAELARELAKLIGR
ncbi:NAD-dependent epimerase/dehydratase family protein [Roseicella aerolata]|uniref:NAD-dependent epimerase/dehydratase family protein n=1 Tax=Roseicella aerolata TaxID=2883479 RepID=A0A9X1IDK1_9PROT|nr:NAD-dependent epimerase/dehydratase family protein [Roseicella aerolata]MCB4822840.1 NAD-dependent epimerase/dehydratase family protein [Roseicella aerolata]